MARLVVCQHLTVKEGTVRIDFVQFAEKNMT